MKTKFRHYPSKPKAKAVINAYIILCNTHDAASSFLDIFESTRKSRKAKGASTNEEQDLLRAMLVFATSGLDSVVKQLIQDALSLVIKKDEGSLRVFKNYVENKIIKSGQINAKLLAMALGSENPREELMQELVRDLTSNSLQSKDELLKVASYFNIPSAQLTNDFTLLERIFIVRNQIIHEMDIDFHQAKRNRRPRGYPEMIKFTNEILRLALVFLNVVDGKLTSS